MLSELVFVFPWYYIEFNVGVNFPENIFQCTLHPPAWGPQHVLCLREGVCLAIYLLLHACWLCHRGRDILCSKCLSGRYASWVLESWPSLCWPLSQRDSPHLWERIVPISFSQMQWVFTGASGGCPGLPFPSPVKAFVSGGDGDRGTNGFAPPAVSAHPVHQHCGRLPGVSQSRLWAPSGVCKEKACSSEWPPHCLCPLEASSWVTSPLMHDQFASPPGEPPPWARMPPVQLNILSPVGAVSGIALWAQHSTWLKRSHGLAICATFFVFVLMLPTKVHLVKALVFPVVMYGCEIWTIKKAECRRITTVELWCWRRPLRIPWTARRSNQSILKEISPEYSLEGLMLKLKLQYLATWCKELTHLKRPWCWEGLKAGGEGETEDEMVRWHHWLNGRELVMDREARCAVVHGVTKNWTWLSDWMEKAMESRLQSMGSLGVRHDWVTSLSLFTFMHWRRKWQPTPLFLPGESQRQGSLVGCHLWGCTESDTTEAT